MARPVDPSEEVDEETEAAYAEYFEALNDGCGCTEIWEFLSERRRGESSADGR